MLFRSSKTLPLPTIASLPTIPQSMNPWVLAVDPSRSLVTTIRFAMDVEGITVGENVIDSIDSTKRRMTTSRSPTYPPLNFQTLFQESLELILTHLSLLPLPPPVTDVLRLATSKKIAIPPFEVSIAAKYVIGKNDCNSTAPTLISPLRLSSNERTR